MCIQITGKGESKIFLERLTVSRGSLWDIMNDRLTKKQDVLATAATNAAADTVTTISNTTLLPLLLFLPLPILLLLNQNTL